MKTRHFLELVLASLLKTVLNISICAAHIYFPGASGHNTAKLRLLRFTEYLYRDHEVQGSLPYAVQPAYIRTGMAALLPEGHRCGADVQYS